MFANSRYGFINGLVSEATTVTSDPAQRLRLTRHLDTVFLHRTLGMPIFLGLMWLMFEATYSLGNYPMDWIDAGVGWLSEVAAAALSAGLVRDLIVDGIIAGVGGTIIFLPNIVILFFFMAIFSETGYLSRAAFLLDRVMHTFGLHGKVFIPLVMGFGCNVPAIMACRTIESPKARLTAILISPFMACTARLPVFVLFAGAFFTEWAGTMVFLMYMLSVVVAMGASVLLGKFVIGGADESFVMELPPFRVPTINAVVFHMWERALGFLKKVAGIILVGSIIIWFLQAFPRDVDYSVDYDTQIAAAEVQAESEQRDSTIAVLKRRQAQESMERSYLGRIGIGVSPVFSPLGFSWQDTVAILTGFVAKEVVVATYAVLYNQGEESTEKSQGLKQAIAGSMSPVAAFAFMVFVLLYSPCLATIAAIRHEAGTWKWAGFSMAFSLLLGWTLALGIVTIGNVVA
jgi:ferrous iron transport protein B